MNPSKTIALGFSSSAYDLLQRLKFRGHVDLIALTPSAASSLDLSSEECLVEKSQEVFRRFWNPGTIFIVVGAIGAVIRTIAPLLSDKGNDPAVLAMDSRAKNIVSILGGHKGGGEEFACHLANDLQSNFVFTGFSRTEEKLAMDSFGSAWGWKRQGTDDQWNDVMVKIAQNLPIFVDQSAGSTLWNSSEGALNVLNPLSNKNIPGKSPLIKICSEASHDCCWHPPTLWVGIGCEKDTSLTLLERAFHQAFDEAGLAIECLAGIATIDIKSDEIAIKAFQQSKNLPMRLYSFKQLVEVNVPNPSKVVLTEVGTPSVAEASSLLAAGRGSNLRFTKHIYKSQAEEQGAVTIAIAESEETFSPKRGCLHLVGSGPGDLGLLTHDSRFALSKSVVWIGYKRYLDLLEPLRRFDQVRIDSSLTNERERCNKALNLAKEGINVSLISSGDSGIYGMAGLALELWLSTKEEDRPAFQVHPGISALQIAAAKIGAPLMHDFCAISLSDRLTPWKTIQARIEASAVSDFVIAFYNPRSKDRNWQLQKALAILLKSRSSNTPIVLARQLARSEEKIEVHMLGSFPIDKVDMLTLLLVGNSESVWKDGYVVTPRGY